MGRAGRHGRSLTSPSAGLRRAGAVALVAVAASAAPAAASRAGGSDFGIRLAGPVGPTGAVLHRPVVAGVPFRMRLELTSSGFTGGASVVYDIDLPTGVHVSDTVRRRSTPLEGDLRTSSCLHACTIGWDTSRRRTLSVYYVLVVPVAADAMVSAHITSTNHHDGNALNDRFSTSVAAVAPLLALGSPELVSGAPRAARRFAITVPVRLDGAAVRPDSVLCTAVVRGSTLSGTPVRASGSVQCSWTLPRNAGGTSLRSTVTVSVRSSRATRTWLFAVGA